MVGEDSTFENIVESAWTRRNDPKDNARHSEGTLPNSSGARKDITPKSHVENGFRAMPERG